MLLEIATEFIGKIHILCFHLVEIAFKLLSYKVVLLLEVIKNDYHFFLANFIEAELKFIYSKADDAADIAAMVCVIFKI